MNDRLYRSRDDRVIAGVAGGVADLLHVDPSLVRVLWVLLLIPTAGFALLLYIAMALVVPEEPARDARWAAARFGSEDGTGGVRPMAFSEPTGLSSSEPIGGPPSTGSAPAGSTSGAPGGAGFNPTAPADGSGGEARDQRRLARDERRELRRQRRDGSGALVAGVVLILVGGYFLVRTYVPAIDVDRAWPIILVAIGVVLLARSVRGSAGPSA